MPTELSESTGPRALHPAARVPHVVSDSWPPPLIPPKTFSKFFLMSDCNPSCSDLVSPFCKTALSVELGISTTLYPLSLLLAPCQGEGGRCHRGGVCVRRCSQPASILEVAPPPFLWGAWNRGGSGRAVLGVGTWPRMWRHRVYGCVCVHPGGGSVFCSYCEAVPETGLG